MPCFRSCEATEVGELGAKQLAGSKIFDEPCLKLRCEFRDHLLVNTLQMLAVLDFRPRNEFSESNFIFEFILTACSPDAAKALNRRSFGLSLC